MSKEVVHKKKNVTLAMESRRYNFIRRSTRQSLVRKATTSAWANFVHFTMKRTTKKKKQSVKRFSIFGQPLVMNLSFPDSNINHQKEA